VPLRLTVGRLLAPGRAARQALLAQTVAPVVSLIHAGALRLWPIPAAYDAALTW